MQVYAKRTKIQKRWYMKKILLNPPDAKDNNFCFFQNPLVIVICAQLSK